MKKMSDQSGGGGIRGSFMSSRKPSTSSLFMGKPTSTSGTMVKSSGQVNQHHHPHQSISLDSFPSELLERIIYNCDGVTIKRCSAVNTRFQKSVVNVSRLRNVWKKCVDEEIEPEVVQELNRLKDTELDLGGSTTDDDNQDTCYSLSSLSSSLMDSPTELDSYLDNRYYKLYTTWYRSLRIGSWPCSATPISGFAQNQITCVKVSGDLIIMGHKGGCVSICDYLSGGFEIAYRHIRMVTDIALVDLAGQSSYKIFKSQKGSQLSVSHHHHIVSISKDQTVRIYPMQAERERAKSSVVSFRPPNGAELLHVRVFNQYCAVYSSITKITIWKMSLPDGSGQPKPDQPLGFDVLGIIVPQDRLPGWFNFWGTHIKTLCPSIGAISEYSLTKGRWHCREPMTMKLDHRIDSLRHISKAFLIRKNLIVIATSGGTLYYSTDGETLKDFFVWRNFTSKVLSITFWGAIMAFGLESGELVIYQCSSMSEIDGLHLKKPVFKRRLHPNRIDEPIIGLDADDYGEGTLIVAVSPSSVSVIKWRPPTQRKL